jgi:hypothetical protein
MEEQCGVAERGPIFLMLSFIIFQMCHAWRFGDGLTRLEILAGRVAFFVRWLGRISQF